jgi:hypothetical protein
MADPSNSESPSHPDVTTARKERSPSFLVLSLFAVVVVTMLGVFATIPLKRPQANSPVAAIVPTATEQALRKDVTSFTQQFADQLREIKRTLASEQDERKRLSDAVIALNNKLEALQKSFARAQEAPVAQPADPAKRNHGSR